MLLDGFLYIQHNAFLPLQQCVLEGRHQNPVENLTDFITLSDAPA